jgi:TetR/AcrR family transcriptional regulator, mexJK operon transcriptional repressor
MIKSAAAMKRSEPGEALTKREAIITGATEMFLREGYGASSMEAIAQLAGVSKQTIYAHFDSKDALFEAIIRQKCDDILVPTVMDGEQLGSAADVLSSIAEGFLNRVLSHENIRLFRIIVGESVRFPELAAAFYRSGPRFAADQLSVFLEHAAAQGELRIDEPQKAAELFFGMLRGDIYMRRLLDIDSAFDGDEAARFVQLTVKTFLQAHAG